MMLKTVFACVTGLWMLLGGCQPKEDLTSGEVFKNALPDQETLFVDLSGTGQQESALTTAQQALTLTGKNSLLLGMGALIALAVNGQATILLTMLAFVTRLPPTVAVEEAGVIGEGEEAFAFDARAVWGPYQSNDSKNLEFTLNIWRGTDAKDNRTAFVYFVAGRPVGAGDEGWVVLIKGGAKPYEQETGNRFGLIKVDLNAMKQLDPTRVDVGAVSFLYLKEGGNRALAAVFDDVWLDPTHTATRDATYLFGVSDQGFAVLEFDVEGNLPQPTGAALETLHVVAGVIVGGSGRADADIQGGDLGTGTATLTECWGQDKKTTYYKLASAGVAQPLTLEGGTAADCISAQPVSPPDVDFEAIRTAFD